MANPIDLVGLLTGQFSLVSLVAWSTAAVASLVVAGSVRAKSNGSERLRHRLFAVLCGLLVVDLVVSAPLVGNHQMILALGSLLVFGAYGWTVFQSVDATVVDTGAADTGAPDTGTVDLGTVETGVADRRRRSAVYGLRLLLLVSYGLIAFSKLNSDYLNPVVSCALIFSDEMSEWFGFAVSESGIGSALAIYGSLVTELSVPILLSVRRLRSAGVLLGLCFHGLLSLEPVGHVYDFTAVLIPYFLLFAPLSVHRRLARTVAGVQTGLSAPLVMAGVLVLLFANLIVIGVGLPAWLLGFSIWLVYLVVIFRVVVPDLIKDIRGKGESENQPEGNASQRVRPSFSPAVLAVLAMVTLNGVAPYVQLKTATAFNMYSNLRVVGEESNHLLVPVGPKLRTPQLYRVSTADPQDPLTFYQDRDLALPEQNLSWYLQHDEAGLDPVDGGAGDDGDGDGNDGWVNVTIEPVTPGQEPFSGPQVSDAGAAASWSFARAFGLWRAVDTEGPAQCLRLWGPAY